MRSILPNITTTNYPFGMLMDERSHYSEKYRFGFNTQEKDNEIFEGAYSAEYWEMDSRLGRRWNIDPVIKYWESPYAILNNSPLSKIDPNGDNADWVEKPDGNIRWDDEVTSADDKDLKAGDKYLGKNVLVGTHNRGTDGNEPINSATFSIYLETNKNGPTASISGNTVPADIEKYGTLKVGLYPARSQNRAKYPNERAIIINEGGALPTTSGNPNNKANDGLPVEQHIMDEVFFHIGNTVNPSLKTVKGSPISAGCQTGGSGPNAKTNFDTFMNSVPTDFNGSYFLRAKPILRIPNLVTLPDNTAVGYGFGF
jgi:hypothetical protein